MIYLTASSQVSGLAFQQEWIATSRQSWPKFYPDKEVFQAMGCQAKKLKIRALPG
jgi:hypothetical protein